MSGETRGDTREQLLETALELIQTRGYNAFSYRDLAQRIGIRTASIHYHFPGKEDLGRQAMALYRQRFASALAEIDRRQGTPLARLTAYVGLFEETLLQDRMCACGMLATELITLPASVQAEVRRFFEDNEAWLANTLRQGQEARQLALRATPEASARAFFGALEGAMIAARAFDDPTRLRETGRQLLASFAPLEHTPPH